MSTDKVEQENKPVDTTAEDKKQEDKTTPEKKVQAPVQFPEGGKFDSDGFWIMPQGDFYDPDGVHFSKDGKDQFGGYYNKQGKYVPPADELPAKQGEFQNPKDNQCQYIPPADQQPPQQQEENKQGQKVRGYYRDKVFIPKIEGAKFNQAGFYELPNGAFYDPLGNYFDEKGYDAMGGFYNDIGEYQQGDAYFDDQQNYDMNDDKCTQFQMYHKKYAQEQIYMADPDKVAQLKLEHAQEIQQEIDQAEEKPGLCVKQYQEVPDIKVQEKEKEQDDEDDVTVQKVSIAQKPKGE